MKLNHNSSDLAFLERMASAFQNLKLRPFNIYFDQVSYLLDLAVMSGGLNITDPFPTDV